MTDLAKLRGEHAELIKIISRLADMVGQPSPPPQLHLFELRRELSSTLIGHLKAEDWVLYPRLLASADPRIASTALAFSQEMGGLAADFVQYSEQWNANAIAANWTGYCKASRELIVALTYRITRENRELYPLLESLDRAA